MPGRRQPTEGSDAGRDREKSGSRRVELDLPEDLADRLAKEASDTSEGQSGDLESLIARALDHYLLGQSGSPGGSLPGSSSSVVKSTDRSPVPGRPTPADRGVSDRGALQYRLELVKPRRANASHQTGPPNSAPVGPGEDNRADDLLRLDELGHREARETFEQEIRGLREPLEILRSRDGTLYEWARDSVLTQGAIIRPEIAVVREAFGEVLASPNDKPLFGLHNRDYPSLWGLMLLARAAADAPIPWSEFASGLEWVARDYGDALREIDLREKPRKGFKYATSFPRITRGPRRPRGGQWIRGARGTRTARLYPFVKSNFARIQEGRGGIGTEALGPLPCWNAVRFIEGEEGLLVEPTKAGLDLLGLVEGISLQLPHDRDKTERFLRFLASRAPGDAAGFKKVLAAIGRLGEREKVVQANLPFFNEVMLGGREEAKAEKLASTMTQGYVARGREWGLIEGGMIDASDGGKKAYVLTAAGQEAITLLQT